MLQQETTPAAALESCARLKGRTRAAQPVRANFGGRLRRGLLISAGVLFVGLGVVGTLVPVLPTTPFLLLAAACFARSSERMHRWLLGNRVFGEYLRRYRNGEGLPLASKVTTLVLLWATLGVSASVAPLLWVRLLLLAVGLGVTIHILRMRTRRRPWVEAPRKTEIKDPYGGTHRPYGCHRAGRPLDQGSQGPQDHVNPRSGVLRNRGR